MIIEKQGLISQVNTWLEMPVALSSCSSDARDHKLMIVYPVLSYNKIVSQHLRINPRFPLGKEVGMSKRNQQDDFNVIHHALLFAWIARAVVERAGEQRGEAIIRKGIRQYGEQRGRRMAQRAQANKHECSMLNYIAYSEYRPTPGVFELKIIERIPHARAQTPKCPWYAAWKENGLLAVGRLYCSEIDTALVHGYNPELQMDLISTLTEGATHCEFVYHNADITIPNYLLIQYRRTISPGMKAVRSWDYHVGHLFSILEKVVIEELDQVGEKAIQAGLAEFGRRYGEQAMRRVVASRSEDYDSVA